MLAHTFTATFAGVQPIKVEVEVDGNRGIPTLVFIGLPSKSTDEARQRITSALQNCGIRIRSKRTIVNLAPAEIPKHGASFDVAIAVGILKMYGVIQANTEEFLFLGELSLEGRIKKIKGCLPLVLAAQQWGFRKVFIPQENSGEVSIVEKIKIYPVSHLRELLAYFQNGTELPHLSPQMYAPVTTSSSSIDFDDIVGQDDVKRALMIAAAGNHNILLNGPPGMGKSMLAQSMSAILPPLTKKEAIEVTNMYSIAGLNSGQLITTRPFRSPHYTITQTGLIGGGNPPKPGEISLAHNGILFLDEFLEYPRHILETLRLPLEEKHITISRVTGSIRFPANFTLVAATNPCPCGYALSTRKACTCPQQAIQRYQHKLSGPLLDRFDLRIQVPEVEKRAFTAPSPLIPNNTYKEIVARVRQTQRDRFSKLNGELHSKEVRNICIVEQNAEKILAHARDQLNLSIRSYFKVLKVAQTIADIERTETIQKQHVSEALQYR
jgi:magnesium chelatase family protein